ncbi:DUF3613 domain-containing protein [Dyella sp. C11]|uniref:DUF3613 domain-containing protein n=1 Tax=Dyella sp. C11 TaxID=2126991 RepID=UPI000D65CE77|nr:DUF3613 domain-containing protein [Dyella sp. C11]
MIFSKTTAYRRFGLASLLVCATCSLHAQQTPITGQMLAPVTPAPAEPAAAPAAPVAVPQATDAGNNTNTSTDVGDVTHQLLSMQAQGTRAGKQLPIPGQEASASYQRYLKSFDHPIPQFFDGTVSKNQSGSTGSSGAP